MKNNKNISKEEMMAMNPEERRELGAKLFGELLERKPELRLKKPTEKVANPERLTKFDRTDDELD